jgi:hypothetical protein
MVMGNLNRDTVARACKWFRSKLEAVVEAVLKTFIYNFFTLIKSDIF